MAAGVAPGAEVLEIAQGLKAMLLQMLKQSIGERRSGGSCLHASVLVRAVVGKFTTWRPTIRGGDGEGDGGYLADDGCRYGHYWVEATDVDEEVWVIDITADQFGGPSVTVATLRSLGTRYTAGAQELVDSHVEHLSISGA